MKFEREVTLKSLICQFQHGFHALSRSNLISSSGFHMSVAALLGVAGVLLGLKNSKLGKLNTLEWLPKTQCGAAKSFAVPGLQNLGNNCFLNVILQALASCSYFQASIQKVLEECKSSSDDDPADNVPLIVSLAALIEELCVVGETRVVLSPRRVMLAVAHYIENFDLSSQQDAEEAFLHLLSALREEFLDWYFPSQCSMVEVLASTHKIITPNKMKNQTEHAKWQQHFFGPFDGILGSNLTCRSCSSQISFNFESFHSLPLSPVLDGGATIMAGCTLEDCLKKFTIAEQVDLRCNHCWHIAAFKYSNSIGVDEAVLEQIERCTEQDSCDCQRIFHLEKLPWSNNFSRILRQLSIARCPKILCIHLTRVIGNLFGEPVKLQGHISFPLVLDLLSFMTSGVGITSRDGSVSREHFQSQRENSSPSPNHFNLGYDPRKLNILWGLTRGSIYQDDSVSDVSQFISNTQCLASNSSFIQTEGFSRSMHADMQIHSDQTRSSELVPLNTCLYRLVAVVEHFGRAGSGHYTVYRSVKDDLCEEQLDDQIDASAARWFSISDSQVCIVSEEDVLSAEASLLFYEKC